MKRNHYPKAVVAIIISAIVVAFTVNKIGRKPAAIVNKNAESTYDHPITKNDLSKNNVEQNHSGYSSDYVTDPMYCKSVSREGFIGIFKNKPIDNPIDNVFHVRINKDLRGNEKVWLEYELKGVQDFTGVSHSINDHLSVGGYFVRKNNEWTKQKELLNPADIRKGDNVICFTLPPDAQYGFQVRNLGIRIEPGTETGSNNSDNRKLVINQPTTDCYYGKLGYLQGYVSGKGFENAKVFVDGDKVRYSKGTFESLVEKPENSGESWSATVKAVFPDGRELSAEVNFHKPAAWDVTNKFNREIHYSEKTVKTNSSFSIQLADAKLYGPSGSVSSTTNLSVTALRDIDVPALDAGMVNVTSGYPGYRFLPHGTKFLKNVTLELGYDSTKIPGGYTENDIRTYYFSEKTNHWVAIPRDSALLAQKTIRSLTNHFTDYINAIIKVPESPETQGYAPTTMNDVKAANPAAGIDLIQPPTANSMGTANLSYPIDLPAGRQGMQPQLAITYNSGGGDSWLGLGWDLSVPSITVETRWGVPHYDPANESETYLMGSDQLSPVAHRSAWVKRTADKQFYPRVEGSFSKIIRHGNSPKNYWWEVTDKSGVKYYYGGVGAIDASAVLTDGDGNIAQWALVKVEDLNKNFITYEYDVQADRGVADQNASEGYQIYLKKITYTGYNGEPGKYTVEFKRDREYDGAPTRKDISVACNYGFKMVTADLLRRIYVKFDGSTIRSYELKYEEGAFYKTLLDSLIEYNSDNKIFTVHTFDYYDDIKSGSDYHPYESNAEIWNTKSDGIEGNFVSSKLGILDDNASAISGTKSKDWGVGLSANVGLGAKVWSKNTSVGGNYSYSQSTSEGQLSLVDINGDGLPDKVMLINGAIKYRPQIKTADGSEKYSDTLKDIILDDGIHLDGFLKSTGKNNSIGLEALIGVSIGANYGFGKTITSTYFSDVNGDGLIDIVQDGTVYFNYIDKNGNVHFSPNSDSTSNKIQSGAIASGLTSVDSSELEKARQDNPLHDVVKMWRAPFDGTVSIKAPVHLIEDTSSARKNYPADGVNVTIQHKGYALWSQRITADDYTVHTPVSDSINNLQVKKGDRIYFRVQSVDDGAYDQVMWAPEISYNDEDTTLTDANGKPIYKFNAADDFVLTSLTGVMVAPIKGKINIESHLTIPPTTDNAKVEILFNDNVYRTIDVNWKKGYDQDINIPGIPVEKEDRFAFRVISSTNINWEKIQWHPEMYYTESDDPDVVDVYDKNGNPIIKAYAVPQFTMYPNNLVVTEQWVAKDSAEITINPSIKFSKDILQREKLGDQYKLTFAVKKRDSLLYKKEIAVNYNKEEDTLIYELPENIHANVIKGESVYLEYYADSLDLSQLINSTRSAITYKEYINDTISCDNPDNLDSLKIVKVITDSDTICVYRDTIVHIDSVNAGLYTSIPEEEQIFGHMYRNWGQFAYNGNGDRASQPINESELNINKIKTSANNTDNMKFDNVNNDTDLQSSFDNQGAYDAQGDKFILMVPFGDGNLFMGQDNLTYVKANIISSSRKGEDRLVAFDPMGSLGSGAHAVDKITKNKSVSFNTSLGSAGANYAHSWDKLITDFMDMNGDRYPDIVTNEKIQYTNQLGALSTGADYVYAYPAEANDYSTSDSYGASVGWTPLGSKKETTNNPKSAKYSLTGNSSLSGNYAVSKTHYTWRDINGDGLPDRINTDDGKVNLNLGYKLAPEESWGTFDINTNQSISIQASAGISQEINIDHGSIKAGIGLGGSRNILKDGLQDVNGDGLPDIVKVDDNILSALKNDGTRLPATEKPVKVWLNTGNGFSSEPVTWDGVSFTNKSKSTNESANIAFTAGFTFVFGKVTFTPSVNLSHGYNKENLTLEDVDGDGFSDYIESDKDNELRVKKSKIGKTNMLKTVHRPLKAAFSLDYAPVGNTYKMPQAVWALSKVEIFDGHIGDGVDKMVDSIEYKDGYRDRYERTFYGFGEVETHQLDEKGKIYRTTDQKFANDNYYEKGLLLSQTVMDAGGNKYVETKNIYKLKDPDSMKDLPADFDKSGADVAFPALVETQKYFCEGESTAQKSTRMIFEYGPYGNVTAYTDYGEPDDNSDDISATIDYWDISAKHILGVPKSVTVTGNNKTYRERETSIDNNTGQITEIRQKLEKGQAVYDMFYDKYGNLDSIVRPANYKGQRMYFAYDYDNTVHNYIVAVRDAYGYSSSSTYDYRFGQVLSTTDINGQQTRYEIDSVGRITKITGPYELASGKDYTIRFAYHPDADVPWAHTQHYDPDHPDNPIETALFIDGLGRVIQTKKDGALFQNKGTEDKEVMLVSGKVEYDAFGRKVVSYYPVTEDKGNTGNFNKQVDNISPTKVEYDVLDRTIKTTLPDGSKTVTNYGFGDDRDGKLRFMTRVTDANGKVTEQFTDVKGRQTAVKAPYSTWTSFVYDPINQLVQVTDAENNVTKSEYDMLGRRLKRMHPDAGTTVYTYDPAGNLLTQLTANLDSANEPPIQYDYDYNRLTNITYPENTVNNVRYEYGTPGAKYNRAGRIVVQEDGTGAQEFFYGPLGEITKNIRSVVVPDQGVFTFETKWQYDTWDRLKTMTYPDGEVLTYNYNTGGMLHDMYGKKKGTHYAYVDRIGYDKFEDRLYMAFGNGTETSYQYEADRRRLNNITTTTPAGRKLMDNTYTYDKVNNITNLKSIAPIPEVGYMGGRFDYNYQYDDLYRLTGANGHFEGAESEDKYSLTMSYSPTGSILHKNQVHQERDYGDPWETVDKTTYNWDYKYEGTKPHAPSQIGPNTYTYDANGNLTSVNRQAGKPSRQILWDEENRIRAIAENGATYHYMYDASGARVIKATGDGQAVYINGFPMGGSGTVGSYTMYVSPYMVVNNMNYTKHIYIGSQRIVSQLGEDGAYQYLLNPKNTIYVAGGDTINWDKKMLRQKDAIIADFEDLGLDGVVFTAGKSGKTPYGQIKKYFREMNGDGATQVKDTTKATANAIEKFRYFYHPDHLGSSSYITDASGEVYQHFEYFPFGETFVEDRADHQRTPYLFNGKELDKETGLYYYGARYYDPRISMWYGVDPLADKYPRWSPYAYVLNNPIKAIDSDGKRVYFVGGAGNDNSGWNYISRWKNAFAKDGINNFIRVNASFGKWGDVAFTSNYRNSGTYYEYNMKKDPGGGTYKEFTGRELPVNNAMINNTAKFYQQKLASNPLKKGEQFNLAGYSYGSVLQAQVALKLANEGVTIDNLVLIGSPISDDSKLYKQLSSNKNIKNIIRIDIEGDKLSNPKSLLEFIQGGWENRNDNGHHFDLARPGKEEDLKIQQTVDEIRKQGVEN